MSVAFKFAVQKLNCNLDWKQLTSLAVSPERVTKDFKTYLFSCFLSGDQEVFSESSK